MRVQGTLRGRPGVHLDLAEAEKRLQDAVGWRIGRFTLRDVHAMVKGITVVQIDESPARRHSRLCHACMVVREL